MSKNTAVYPDSTMALQLHLCANQPKAWKIPRLPAAKTMVITPIACEQRLKMVI